MKQITAIMEFKIIYPSPTLIPFVKYYWVFERNYLAPTIERGVPIGCMQLVFHRKNRVFSTAINDFQSRTFIEGQMSSYWDLHYKGENETIAVTFTPQGAKAFLSTSMAGFYNRNIPIECLEDKLFSELQQAVLNADNKMECIGIIEQYLLRRLAQLNPSITNYEYAIQQMESNSNVTIKKLSYASNICYKQYNRRFVNNMGINPKHLTRIIRFQKTLSALQNGFRNDLTELAFRCGYYDASHVIKEFREFSGHTPNEYINMYNPFSDYFLQKELIQNKIYDQTRID